MTEEALVHRDADLGTGDLAPGRLAAQLPRDLADLSECLCWHSFAETRKPAGRIHWHSSAKSGVPIGEQPLGLALFAEADVLVPVELESRNESSGAATAAAESVAKFGISITVFGKVGETVEIARTRTGDGAPCRRAYSIDASTMAAPPSDVAHISNRCNGWATTGEASASSSVTAFRYLAFGLARPCSEFFTLTRAKSRSVAP